MPARARVFKLVPQIYIGLWSIGLRLRIALYYMLAIKLEVGYTIP